MNWLFRTPTKAIEAVSCIAMWGFAIVLAIDERVLELPSHTGFMQRWNLVAVFLLVGVVCASCLFKRTSNAVYCSGYTLLVVAMVWGIIGAQYIFSFPPLTLEMVLYPLLGLISWMAGLYNIKQSRRGPEDGLNYDAP